MLNSFNWLQTQVKLIWSVVRKIESNSGGNYIPLSGTEEGKPITGGLSFENLYISSEQIAYSTGIGIERQIVFNLLGNGICISDYTVGTKGLFGNYYYGANYDDNTYVQKKYVDDKYPTPPVTGTHTLQSIDGVMSWKVVTP